jgi:hypothetical protein
MFLAQSTAAPPGRSLSKRSLGGRTDAAEAITTAFASAASLATAGGLLALARVDDWRKRAYLTFIVLAAVLAVMLAQPFRPHAEGDYSLYVRNREDFLERFGSAMQFQYYLSGTIIHWLDEAFGKTAHSPVQAFSTLTRLGSVVFVVGLALFIGFQRYSPRALRYAALVFAAPPTLLLFGYHEFGYLPDAFIVCAIPLIMIGLEADRDSLIVGGSALLGIGSALHGFGLIACVFMFIVVLVYQRKQRDLLLRRLVEVAGGVSIGWLSFLAFLFIGAGLDVVPGNADITRFRPLFHTKMFLAENRYDYAVFSSTGLRDILFEFIILGVFVTIGILFVVRGGRMWEAVVMGTAPVILFVIFFWPVQGLGNDTDFLGAAFPSLYASSWLASRSNRLSLIVAIVLGISQAAMLYVVHGDRFVHSRDF